MTPFPIWPIPESDGYGLTKLSCGGIPRRPKANRSTNLCKRLATGFRSYTPRAIVLITYACSSLSKDGSSQATHTCMAAIVHCERITTYGRS